MYLINTSAYFSLKQECEEREMGKGISNLKALVSNMDRRRSGSGSALLSYRTTCLKNLLFLFDLFKNRRCTERSRSGLHTMNVKSSLYIALSPFPFPPFLVIGSTVSEKKNCTLREFTIIQLFSGAIAIQSGCYNFFASA